MIQDALFSIQICLLKRIDLKKKQKKRSKNVIWTKKASKSHFGYKLHGIIERDYELIRRFKAKTASFHDFHVDLSEVNEVVYRDRGYFRAKSKGYDSTIER